MKDDMAIFPNMDKYSLWDNIAYLFPNTVEVWEWKNSPNTL